MKSFFGVLKSKIGNINFCEKSDWKNWIWHLKKGFLTIILDIRQESIKKSYFKVFIEKTWIISNKKGNEKFKRWNKEHMY
jgi:hypothetical protein